jgi:hypothetical protein
MEYYAADPVVCYSAKVDVCAAGTKICSAEQAAAGIWVWQCDAMQLSLCYQQQWAASVGDLTHVQGVNCCGSDLCNNPNLAGDNTTQVRAVYCVNNLCSHSVHLAADLLQHNAVPL